LDVDSENIDFDLDTPAELAYIPCVNHNLELCLKDAFKKIKKFDNLKKKIAKFVVKCRKSTIIATSLESMKKTIQKNNTTRWNSIKTLLHSYNNITDDELNVLLSVLKEVDQRSVKLTLVERQMARELEIVFDDFLYASKEFQSKEVTSSLVYPAISYLKSHLVKDLHKFKYTKELRQELVKSLCSRFGKQLNNEVFLFATFLDPNFGPLMLPQVLREDVISRLTSNIIKNNLDTFNSSDCQTFNSSSKKEFTDRFMRFEDNLNNKESNARRNSVESIIKDYMTDIVNFKGKCVLTFWKEKESRWLCLSKVAKKVLGVPASSSGCERMFSIAGHVHSLKRRRMKAYIFESLVFCKLNEFVIKLIKF
jgi:hypothetical protein